MRSRPPDGYDAVLVFGGQMNVDEEDEHPWLRDEDELIRTLLARDVPLLGVCLGGQLLAKAAGAHVGPSPESEARLRPGRVDRRRGERSALRVAAARVRRVLACTSMRSTCPTERSSSRARASAPRRSASATARGRCSSTRRYGSSRSRSGSAAAERRAIVAELGGRRWRFARALPRAPDRRPAGSAVRRATLMPRVP